MSTSYAKLRGKIKEKYGSQDNFAAAMKMMEQGVIGPLSGAAWCAALTLTAWICGILGEAMYRV